MRRAGRTGLTLIEVLVATVLCGAGLVVACLALGGVVRSEDGAAQRVLAARALDRLMARVEAEELPLTPDKGDFGAEGEPWLRWEITVGAGEVEGLQELTFTVRWTTPRGELSLDVQRAFFVDPLGTGKLR